MDKVKKIFNFEVKQIGNEVDRKLLMVGSTETQDRDGDIIEALGWDLTDYKNNPVIMGFHEYDKFPYARSEKTYIDAISKQLKFEVKFPTIDELTSYPNSPDMIAEHAKNVDLAYNMYRNGYMRAVSVGFIGKESEPIMANGSYIGKRYKKQSLLELSLVPVPSCPDALSEARSKGIINDNEFKMFEESKTVVAKPGWDETETSFRFRVRDPALFQDGTFRTVPIKEDKPRVNSVMGKLIDEDTMTVQSLIFPKEDDWDLAAAKTWLKEHEDLTKGADDMGKNLAVIIEQKTEITEIWKCPHCLKQIGEKELYNDDEKWFHRPCKDAGGILLPKDNNSAKSFLSETKKPDLQGNPSMWDIYDAIRCTINPACIYNGDGPYIDDLYPTRYPSGSVIIEKMERCYLYEYEYKDGIVTLSTGFTELEEVYKPKGYFKKSGATLSSKTKKILDEIHTSLAGCGDRLRKLIDASGMMDDDPPDKDINNETAEIKQALEDIKSQVLLLSPKPNQKDANEDINLDAIEFPKVEKDAAQNELDIKPEELKEIIKEIINNQIKGGM